MTTKKTNKAILHIGYQQFVLEPKAATELFLTLTGGTVERFDNKWNKDTNVSEPRVTPVDSNEIRVSLLPEDVYAMGKLLYAADQSNKDKGE
jgi:hypothetical protein